MDPIHYYISRDNGPQEGPFTSNQIGLFISTGRLALTDLIWREGLTNWQSCDSLPEVAELFQRVVPSVSAPVGPSSRPYERKYANFWVRLVACIIDNIIISACQFPISFGFVVWIKILGPNNVNGPINPADPLGLDKMNPEQLKLFVISVIITNVIKWLYYAFMESSRLQGSVGKWALGLQVTTMGGERITFLRATGRYFASFLSSIPFGVGYLVIAFTPQKQAFHDVLAATVVIHKRQV